ncbi:MAG: GAF domain-containing protein, partial [Halobacteriota archaeon]
MSGERAPIRVLHVDDDPDVAELAASFLEREDDRIEVTTAESASEGLDMIDGVDCVVSDFEMPGTGGIEFLERVRDDHPDLPFILYTGKGSEDVASDAIAAGVTDYLQKETGTGQYALLANRITNAVAQYRSTTRAETLDRIRRVVRDVNQTLIRARSREDLESSVVDILSEARPYAFVWIGEPDDDAGVVTARVSAGNGDGYLESIDITLDDGTAAGPTERAIDARELVVTQSIPDDPAFEPWRDAALERGFRASAAVPIRFEDTVYGVLNVYTDEEGAFDAAERDLLVELGDDVGHAIHRIESELQFKQLFDRFPEPTVAVTFDEEEPILEAVNPAFESVFGYDAETVRGRSANELIVPVDRQDEARDIDERSRRDELIDQKIQRETADGIQDFQLRNIPIPGATGPDLYWVYEDITEQRERTRALQRERERFASLFESFPASVVALSYVDGEPIVQDVNSTFETVFGYDETDVLGQSLNELIVPDERRGEASSLDRRLRERDLIDREVQRLATDGLRDFVLRTITLSDEHELDTYSVYIDVSDRVNRERAMAALHDAATELESAETTGEVCEATIDAAEDILDFALIAIDVHEDGALVQRAWSLDRETDGYYSRTPLEEDTLATRAYKRNETILVDDLSESDVTPADSEYRSALTVPMGDVGTFQTVSRTASAFDETDRELAELLVGHAMEALRRLDHAESLRSQRERLRRENERLDTFVNVLSHDIRNPITVVEGRVELAREECESEDLTVAADALDRMTEMVEDVLTWAKEGRHVAEEEREPVALARLTKACWQNVQTSDATLD